VSLDPDSLRRAAIEALGPFGDARAVRLLELARIALEADAAEWEGSDGTVHAHRIRLGVDGAGLAHIRLVPAIADAVTAALSAALPPGHALLDLSVRWGVRTATPGASYRIAPGAAPAASPADAEHVKEALLAYLEAAGETIAAVGRIDVTGDRVTVYGAFGAGEQAALRRAVAALTEGRARLAFSAAPAR
jgi:hypothetical protein